MHLRVAALLEGPRGSGRSTAARAAATALGLNFIPWSCAEIKVRIAE
jgi:MoxR-like ATPase